MGDKLSYSRKNKLLLPLAGAGILLCWFFAFSKTFQAIQLHGQLKEQSLTSADISFNPAHTQKKLQALDAILKSYKAGQADWSNALWMKASAMAMKQGVGIDYTMSKPSPEIDSLAAGLSQTLYCYGNYIQLIRLVDTLERTKGIGRISALQIRAPKEDLVGERAGKSVLRLEFRALQ